MAERQFTLPPLPPRHIISYDLDNGHLRDQDYQRLERDLTGLGGTRVLLSQWVVRIPNTTAAALLNTLITRPWFETADRMLVTSLDSGDHAASNPMTDLDTF